MSTERDPIEAVEGNPGVTLTSFFGGTDRGRCIQLTQVNRNTIAPIALTQEQALRMIARLSEWVLDGLPADKRG